jgi:type VI protein secretion system component VasF
MIENDIRTILVKLAEMEGKRSAAEEALKLARADQDEWRDEIRDELREIRTQVTATNGTVRRHEITLAQMRGVASVFSWWKTALGGCVVAVLAYYLTTL